jgi:hypothetical protein
MPYRKKSNTDEKKHKEKLLAVNRELDEHSEKTDEEDNILERWSLHKQQIDVENKEEGGGDESEKKSKLTTS